MDKWGQHPAVYALEPVNEPWGPTPRNTLYQFYRDVRDIVHGSNPDVKFVFYAYDFSDDWNNLFDDDDHHNVVMDTHYYQAWWSAQDSIQSHCGAYWDNFAIADKIKYELWIGEWSLATDVCAMWLGGFNDNSSPYVHTCKWVDCPKPYLTGDVAIDLDRSAGKLGPFGNEDTSTPNHGQCPTDSDFWPDSDMTYFGQCIMEVMDRYT